jgi:hypothetical protein
MPPFRHVEGEQAGPNALGILIPPGHRTLVILRPRALDWDLLLLSPFGDQLTNAGVWELIKRQAESMAPKVQRALQDWASGGQGGPELVPLAEGGGYRIRVAIGALRWLVCRRLPGKPYQPMTFPSEEEARTTATELAGVLCPDADANQELYFNTYHFSR